VMQGPAKEIVGAYQATIVKPPQPV
jgi:hypothetical protein